MTHKTARTRRLWLIGALALPGMLVPSVALADPIENPADSASNESITLGSFEAVPEAATSTPSPDAVSPNATAEVCIALINSDNPHISNTSATYAAQVHGWWTSVGCASGARAVVTTNIQKQVGSIWMTVGATGVKTVYSGGGSANRSTGHYDCNGIVLKNNFRSRVDVDLVDYYDTPNPGYGPSTSLWCG